MNHIDVTEAEQAVIGSLLLIGDMSLPSADKIMSYLRESSFQHRPHRLVWRAIIQLARRGENVDLITIDAQLKSTGDIEDIGGYSYIAELAKNTPSAANAMAYADIIRQAAIKRTISSKLQNAIAMVNDPDGGSIYEKLGLVETELASLSNRAMQGRQSGLVHVSEIGEKWAEDLERRFENPSASFGFTTGISGIDQIIAPKNVPPGSLVVVGARPKMGKTALLNMITKHFSLHHKTGVAMFSLEMPSDQIYERMISERARVDSAIFYRGASDDADFAKTSIAIGEYNESKLYIDDTAGIGIAHIQSESRKLAKTEKMGLICVDYLTLMKAEKADRNDLAYGEITKALKNLAKELNCVVLLLTQLNRALESRTNKRPLPSDSRDTGQIEQDCDLWIGLYRDSFYYEDSPMGNITEAILRYNRHGKTGTAYLELKDGYFVDASHQDVNYAMSQSRSKKNDF